MSRLLRSLLFVPGNNQRFLEKAKTLSADIVCFDLEDSPRPSADLLLTSPRQIGGARPSEETGTDPI